MVFERCRIAPAAGESCTLVDDICAAAEIVRDVIREAKDVATKAAECPPFCVLIKNRQ